MARPADISTKTVSLRIPMDKYISLLNEAYEHKISMSELLLLRLFSPEKKSKSVNKPTQTPVKERGKKSPKNDTSIPRIIYQGSKSEVWNKMKKNRKTYGFNRWQVERFMGDNEREFRKGKYELRYPRRGRLQLWQVES